jgi:hypothetical protein
MVEGSGGGVKMFIVIQYTATGHRTVCRTETFEEAIAAAKASARDGNGVSIRFVRGDDVFSCGGGQDE